MLSCCTAKAHYKLYVLPALGQSALGRPVHYASRAVRGGMEVRVYNWFCWKLMTVVLKH